MRTTVIALLAVVALAGCKVKVNDEGKLPGVDVKQTSDGGATINVKPGEMPEVDVRADSSVQLPEVKAPNIEAPDVKLPSVEGTDTTRRDTAHRG